ncbi:MAG TPA: hypothetical protein VFF02_12095 [Anaeromyxobacteraceae bacterium]|nr:hypothetical protein [Anaeromyxobacteraceae bacterium]
MRIVAALALAALAAGCKLTNDTVLVAMLVQSPPVLPLGITGSTVTEAQLFLGHTSVTSPSAGDVKPVSGATVKLLRGGTEVATLAESTAQPGLYEASGDFYQAGSTFRFTAQVGSDQYWGEVTNAPPAPSLSVPGMDGTTRIATYPSYAGTPQFTDPYPLSRACSGLCDVAFYGVWSLSGSSFNWSATPNCTNAPQDGAALLRFAFLDDSAWRVNPFNVSKPGCFPTADASSYLVGLTALKKGTTSGNTGIASVAYAGTSDAAGVIVSAP